MAAPGRAGVQTPAFALRTTSNQRGRSLQSHRQAHGTNHRAAGSVGVGLRHEHASDIFERAHAVDFFEVHAENYMGAGGPPHHLLGRIRSDHPISIHGVGLSIGGAAPLSRDHLKRLKRLIDIYQPALFSEHLAWSGHDGVFLNDLLPLPYDNRTLARVCEHVDEVQSALGTRMLLENPATYLAFEDSAIAETEFLAAVARATGCGLLLDVNNVYVSAVNHGFDAAAYIERVPVELVGEIHLAGFAEDRDAAGARLLIDDHGRAVAEAVWNLYRGVVRRRCFAPTLVEWDNNVPAWAELAAEASRARAIAVSHVEPRQQAVAA
jgi:uncharacterized protein (UPF0276 family)